MKVECPNPACPTGTIITRVYPLIADRGISIFSHLMTISPLARGLIVCWCLPLSITALTFAVAKVGPSVNSIAVALLISLAFCAIYLSTYNRSLKVPITVHKCTRCGYSWPVPEQRTDIAAQRIHGQENEVIFQRTAGNKRNLGLALLNLSTSLLLYRHDADQATALCTEALTYLTKANHKVGVALTRYTLGLAALYRGDVSAAQALFNESLSLFDALSHWQGRAATLANIGVVHAYQGDYVAANEVLRESLHTSRKLGDVRFCVNGVLGLAWVAGSMVQPVRAARLFGAGEALHQTVSPPRPPFFQHMHDQVVAAVRAQQTEAAFQAAWAEGKAMSVEQAIVYALTEEEPAPVALG